MLDEDSVDEFREVVEKNHEQSMDSIMQRLVSMATDLGMELDENSADGSSVDGEGSRASGQEDTMVFVKSDESKGLDVEDEHTLQHPETQAEDEQDTVVSPTRTISTEQEDMHPRATAADAREEQQQESEGEKGESLQEMIDTSQVLSDKQQSERDEKLRTFKKLRWIQDLVTMQPRSRGKFARESSQGIGIFIYTVIPNPAFLLTNSNCCN